MHRKRGFTLLEVLIAVGVLFVIGSAVLSLSNTLIQGTIGTADSTVTNLWATEALELVTKNRDDRTNANANQAWLEQAETYNNYGWYRVELNGALVTLEPAGLTNRTTKAQAFGAGESLTSEGLTASRLVCIEAVGANSQHSYLTSDQLGCNLNNNQGIFTDGQRRIAASCETNDLYCQMTRDSLNKNNSGVNVIPAGSAVKVRAVLVWQNQFGYQTTDLGTMLTNWRSVGQ